MRTYVYQCENPRCHGRFEVRHGVAGCDDAHPCPACGGRDTHRVPQAVGVNWGGLAPSQGELSPAMRELVDEGNRQRRLARYAQEKAARGR
jgi:putative FmdB family regulatory protein